LGESRHAQKCRMKNALFRLLYLEYKVMIKFVLDLIKFVLDFVF
jgi:hypothetical protein